MLLGGWDRDQAAEIGRPVGNQHTALDTQQRRRGRRRGNCLQGRRDGGECRQRLHRDLVDGGGPGLQHAFDAISGSGVGELSLCQDHVVARRNRQFDHGGRRAGGGKGGQAFRSRERRDRAIRAIRAFDSIDSIGAIGSVDAVDAIGAIGAVRAVRTIAAFGSFGAVCAICAVGSVGPVAAGGSAGANVALRTGDTLAASEQRPRCRAQVLGFHPAVPDCHAGHRAGRDVSGVDQAIRGDCRSAEGDQDRSPGEDD